MTFGLQEIARAVEAAGNPPPPHSVAGWSVDTRTIAVGDLYFALRGPNHDGHAFVRAAREQGAVAAVVERPSGGQPELMYPIRLPL